LDSAIEKIIAMWQSLPLRIAMIVVGSVVAALLMRWLFHRIVSALVKKTESEVDDQMAHAVRTPILLSLVLAGAAWAVLDLELEKPYEFVCLGVIKTLLVLIWAFAGMRVGTVILEAVSRQVDRIAWVQPKTLPLFDIVLKVLVVGGALYFAFIAWNINVTSWLASAGIVGIAVGFAAKDTLANLFAGIFILADAPYKLGDFIILDNNLRGIVTDIGIRSTRLLTRDDVEITVPNAVIGNSKIINESSGPYQKMRVRVTVYVAYGSDIDRVREVLMSCTDKVEQLSTDPAPRVRFREFGDSGLKFQLMAWIDEPVYRGWVLDQLNANVYKALNEAGIEIPYQKHDVYIKESDQANSNNSQSRG
jgi:small-conductance mechanosensitive channel